MMEPQQATKLAGNQYCVNSCYQVMANQSEFGEGLGNVLSEVWCHAEFLCRKRE